MHIIAAAGPLSHLSVRKVKTFQQGLLSDRSLGCCFLVLDLCMSAPAISSTGRGLLRNVSYHLCNFTGTPHSPPAVLTGHQTSQPSNPYRGPSRCLRKRDALYRKSRRPLSLAQRPLHRARSSTVEDGWMVVLVGATRIAIPPPVLHPSYLEGSDTASRAPMLDD